MASIQESRERKGLFGAPRSALNVPGEGGGLAAWWMAVREGGGWFLVLFMTMGLVMVGFGLAGTFGPYRDKLREGGDPGFFYALMVMGTLFALFALRMLQLVATGASQVLRRRNRRMDPRKPWTGDYPWKPAGQDPDGVGNLAGSIVGRLAFFLFIGFFNVAWMSGQWIFRVIIVILDLFGLLIFYDTAQQVWQRLRHGRPRMVWLTFPAFTGSRLEASFRSRRRLYLAGPPRVTLRCVRDVWKERPPSKSGTPPPQLEPEQIYEQVTEIPIAEDQKWIDTFRVDLALPADLPGTDLTKEEAVYWQLAVEVPVLGPDFGVVFLAPVYKKR